MNQSLVSFLASPSVQTTKPQICKIGASALLGSGSDMSEDKRIPGLL